MLTIAEIMTPDPFTLTMDTSVEEAAWALSRRHIGGAPVLDQNGRVAGFISKSDLVDPAWREWVSPRNATVGDVMHPTVLALPPEAPAMAGVDGMTSHRIHHVMVVDAQHHLVGIVTSFDVMRALSRGRHFDDAMWMPVLAPLTRVA
jgi:CBS domain-containing protein